jgi:chromosomal replication initiation ATPase DnaA
MSRFCPECGQYCRRPAYSSDRYIGLVQRAASEYGVTADDVTGSARFPMVIRARFVAAYVLRNHYRLSFPEVARVLNKDHSSVMRGIKAVARRMGEFGDVVERLTAVAVEEGRAA